MKKYLAELLGTFFLVFAGTGAIVIDQVTQGGVTPVGIGLTFGFVVTVLIYALGPISGAHLNPAVSIAFALTRHFPVKELPGYILSQLVGAILASLIILLLFGNVAHLGASLPAGSELQSLGLEFLLSFLLMFVIMSVATGTKEVGQMAGLAIGLTVGLEAIFAGPICGASMNPARSFGPALVSLNLDHNWIYWLGPIIGACLGGIVFNFIRDTHSR
ncbi:MAG: MIP family channel protein [Candidatus Melainabacteria bacterium]